MEILVVVDMNTARSKNRRNPLNAVWNTLNTIGGIVGLSSMIQNWASDLFEWRGFIATFVDAYRGIAEPVLHFLFAWLPFTVPNWVGDYLFVGTIVVFSANRSALSGEGSWSDSLIAKLVVELEIAVICIPIWPLFIFYINKWNRDYQHVKRAGTEVTAEQEKDLISDAAVADFLSWLGAIVLIVVVLLALNAYFLSP